MGTVAVLLQCMLIFVIIVIFGDLTWQRMSCNVVDHLEFDLLVVTRTKTTLERISLF